MVTRRDLLKGALGTGALLLLTACGSQPAAPAKPAEPAKPTESKPAAPAAAAPTQAAPASAAKPAASAPAGKPQPGGTIRIALSSEITTLDPHLSTSSQDRQVYQGIYDSLVRLG